MASSNGDLPLIDQFAFHKSCFQVFETTLSKYKYHLGTIVSSTSTNFDGNLWSKHSNDSNDVIAKIVLTDKKNGLFVQQKTIILSRLKYLIR